MGLDVTWLAPSLRAHGALYHYDLETKRKSHRPCMVARVVDMDGQPVTLHRTYLSADGFKANVSPSQVKKLMTGKRKLNGDAVRLNLPTTHCRKLIVCEGIETGLAIVAATGYQIDVWAMLNAGNLAKARIPRERFDTVVIAADRDPVNPKNGWRAGEHFAEQLRDRLNAEGFHTILKVPEQDGQDFLDVWNDRCRLRLAA
jgi:putative DNA primase/helicase